MFHPYRFNRSADERVDYFLSDVTVNRDGSLDVREQLSWCAQRAGKSSTAFFETCPKSVTDESGAQSASQLRCFLGAKRDMKSENYVVEPLS